jgi:hypothetical protein
MLRLFEAGFVGGCIQVLAVAISTGAILLLIQMDWLGPTTSTIGPQAEPGLKSAASLLTQIDVLMALGVALSGNRIVDVTSVRLRQACHSFCPSKPDHAAKTLLVQLVIASLGFLVLAFRSPPPALIQLANALGSNAAASFAWPGLMSIGAAAFGANAHACAKAL